MFQACARRGQRRHMFGRDVPVGQQFRSRVLAGGEGHCARQELVDIPPVVFVGFGSCQGDVFKEELFGKGVRRRVHHADVVDVPSRGACADGQTADQTQGRQPHRFEGSAYARRLGRVWDLHDRCLHSALAGYG